MCYLAGGQGRRCVWAAAVHCLLLQRASVCVRSVRSCWQRCVWVVEGILIGSLLSHAFNRRVLIDDHVSMGHTHIHTHTHTHIKTFQKGTCLVQLVSTCARHWFSDCQILPCCTANHRLRFVSSDLTWDLIVASAHVQTEKYRSLRGNGRTRGFLP